MFPIINLGPLAIQTKGLIILVGIYIGFIFLNSFSKKVQVNSDHIENVLITGILVGLISARIGFVLQNLSSFLIYPGAIFSLHPTMLNFEFGLLLGIIAVSIYCQRKELLNWKTLDIFSVFLATAMPFFYFSKFASNPAYVSNINLPSALSFFGTLGLPLQIFETISALFVFITYTLKTKGWSKSAYKIDGIQFLSISGLFILIRHLFEPFRAESPTIFNQIHSLQILTWILMALISILILSLLSAQNERKNGEQKWK